MSDYIRKFINKEGHVYWVKHDFEISIMEKEGYKEVIEKKTSKKKTEK